MNRSEMISRIGHADAPWDLVVIGGGATGLGCAIEAASRGYQTLLLEQDDFAKGTSSRSTKLVHGGVRYLQQGNISRSGLVTITGGKWTTYRKMAQDTIDHAATIARLDEKPSVTTDLPIHGHHNNAEKFGDLAVYGADAQAIRDLVFESSDYKTALHPNLTTITAEVVWAVRNEMARTVEDFLARRTRALLLDARASMEMAPKVASLMAKELNRDTDWANQQIEAYRELAGTYILS